MKTALYPTITVSRITNPNRFYAFPLLGFLVKIIMLIPQCIEMIVLMILIEIIVLLINPFVVLFTGKYWSVAYELLTGYLKLSTKITFFLTGLTNKYPGFDFTIHDTYTIDIPKPASSSRFFAIPLLGFIARVILLIPFYIFMMVINYAAALAMIGGSFPVLFKGYYPETSFELVRDNVRLSLAFVMYFFGISDTYPSFKISMNHKTIKWILIIISALYLIANYGNAIMHPKRYDTDMQYNDGRMMEPQEMMKSNSDYQNMMQPEVTIPSQ